MAVHRFCSSTEKRPGIHSLSVFVRVVITVILSLISASPEARAQAQQVRNARAKGAPKPASKPVRKASPKESSLAEPSSKMTNEFIDEYNSIMDLTRADKYKEAEPRAVALSTKYPDIFEAQCLLSGILIGLNKESEAYPVALKAVRLNPSSDIAWGQVGSLSINEGKIGEAIEAYKKAAALCKKPDKKKDYAFMVMELSKNGGGKPTEGSYLAQMTLKGIYFHWSKERMPLKVYIFPGASKNYQDSFRQDVIDAFAEWESKTEKTVSFTQVDTASGADITIQWVNRGETKSKTASADHANGYTEHKLDRFNNQDHVSIEIVTNPDSYWADADSRIRLVALHEIGHGIGIEGHSDNVNNIMYKMSAKSRGVSQADVDTVKALYQTYPRVFQSKTEWLEATETNKKAMDLNDEACDLSDRGKLSESVVKLREVVKMAPQFTSARQNLVITLNDLAKKVMKTSKPEAEVYMMEAVRYAEMKPQLTEDLDFVLSNLEILLQNARKFDQAKAVSLRRKGLTKKKNVNK